jgi:hypothetical protein
MTDRDVIERVRLMFGTSVLRGRAAELEDCLAYRWTLTELAGWARASARPRRASGCRW